MIAYSQPPQRDVASVSGEAWMGFRQLNIIQTLRMDKREYTPTKASVILSAMANTQAGSTGKSGLEYSQRMSLAQDAALMKEYEILKGQVRQLEQQSRQLSTQAERLRYEKSIQENKYLQSKSFEQQAHAQFQKERNYQLELLKLKGEEEANRIRRDYELKVDELQRELKNRDYIARQLGEKQAYLQLKAGELRKGVETLQGELVKYRENNSNLSGLVSQEEYRKKKLEMLTEQLDQQKCQMEGEIHVLLDIQAEKSRTINALQVQLRNSEAIERALHEKLAVLTDNFAALEDHISLMKERLLSADMRNDQGEKELRLAEETLAGKEEVVAGLKDQEVRLRQELQREQTREMRREKELGQLIGENERLYQQLEAKKQRLHEMCISQGIDI